MSSLASQVERRVITAAARQAVGHDQDRVWDGVVPPTRGGVSGAGVVVCDGVGSEPDSAQVAQLVIDAVGTALESGEPVESLPVIAAAAIGGTGLDGSTTMLAAVARESGRIEFVAVGNGGVIEIAVLAGHEVRVLGWTDHFIPHLDFEAGRDCLTAFLSPGSPPAEFTVGTLAGKRDVWRILLLCSDGVSTMEDRRQGRVGDGSLWSEVPAQLDALLVALRSAVSDLAGGVSVVEGRTILRASITEVLERLHADGVLEDDAAIAVAVLPPSNVPVDKQLGALGQPS